MRQNFASENAKVLTAVDQVRAHTKGRWIWVVERGGDRRTRWDPLDRVQHVIAISGSVLPRGISHVRVVFIMKDDTWGYISGSGTNCVWAIM